MVSSCLEVFINKWMTAAEEGRPVRVFKDVSKLSLDIIMRCAFSSKSNCQLSEDHPYINTVSELVLQVNKRYHSMLYASDFISTQLKEKSLQEPVKLFMTTQSLLEGTWNRSIWDEGRE